MHSAVGVHPDPKVPGKRRRRRRWVQMGAPDENSDRTEMLGGLLKNNINHLDEWTGSCGGPRRLSRSMSSMQPSRDAPGDHQVPDSFFHDCAMIN